VEIQRNSVRVRESEKDGRGGGGGEVPVGGGRYGVGNIWSIIVGSCLLAGTAQYILSDSMV
jgi:hypothetical protein